MKPTVEQLSEALERAELKLQQANKMIELQKNHISQLETIVIQVRNAVTPRGQQKPSAEMEPTHG
jgi:hypothetical protein